MRELGAPPVPAEVAERYADWTWDVAWHYHPHAITYRLRRAGDVRFVKVTDVGWHPSVRAESARMRWAASYLPVPVVLEDGGGPDAEWMVTEALPGLDATHRSHRSDVEALVRVAARGLRAFHEAAPVTGCPFDFRLDVAIAWARARLARGEIDAATSFHAEFAELTPATAVARLERTRPAAEDLVVCHGDYCLPNLLIANGRVTGFVDLGELGVADRWWDLAVGTWSLGWNLGPGYERLFLDEYGAELDRERLVYYRLLYDVVS